MEFSTLMRSVLNFVAYGFSLMVCELQGGVVLWRGIRDFARYVPFLGFMRVLIV